MWVVLPAVLASCDPNGADAFVAFANNYARAVCHRMFECCAPTDAVSLSHATDEAGCVTVLVNGAKQNGVPPLNAGIVRFDASAATQCLADVQAACSTVFSGEFGSVVTCDRILVGTGALGSACDDDFVCASSDCESQRCVVRPTFVNPCSTTQFFDVVANVCTPLGDVGATCTLSGQCLSTLTCLGGHCAARQTNGQPCNLPDQCTGTCTAVSNTPGAGMCRAGFCQGS
jgi:hypothetical protein